ncbi:MAG: dienelactone hydrolase family protein [Gammaproteobacteria bacterium]|nr:dienelactone hydrolase family protein [Gammaproteobacteria bacterium]
MLDDAQADWHQPGFALHVDFYGPCFQDLASPALTGGPILTLRGTADASNDLVACARREQQLRDAGIEVQTHIYEGAGHMEVNRACGLGKFALRERLRNALGRGRASDGRRPDGR